MDEYNNNEPIICVDNTEQIYPPYKKKTVSPWAAALIISLPICIATIIICIAVTVGFGIIKTKRENINPIRPIEGSITLNPSDINKEAIASALSSVVNIENIGTIGGFFNQNLSLGDGMGVIVREDGYILTSAYLVESVGTVTVRLTDKTEHEAEVVNVDSQNGVALLKIDMEGLIPVLIGNSDEVKVGDSVLSIGTPLSESLSNPITVGMVSGVDRGVELQSGRRVNIFQVDASGIAESIGGLVLNQNGELIGISTGMISNSSSELGIVTPVNDLKATLDNIVHIEGGSSGLTIGISGTDASYGVVISMIAEGSAAQKAGLQNGDLIVKVDGETVDSVDDINNIKLRHKKGDTMVFSVYREGSIIDINVILE